jgi:hypothetical protein
LIEEAHLKIYTIPRKAARRWLLRMVQPCQAVVPVMSESLERQLGLLERTQLRLHLLVCAWCARYLKQIELLRELMQVDASQASLELAPKMSGEARERIVQALKSVQPR